MVEMKTHGRMILVVGVVFALLLLATIAGCSAHHIKYKPGTVRTDDHDRQTVAQPEVADPVLAWQSLDKTVWRQGEELLDIDRDFRKLFGRPKEAFNINRFDEVPNSSWFTNRIGFGDISADSLLSSAEDFDGPDTAGVWTVFRHKEQGQMPGLWIKDARGQSYIIKFDPATNPEMHTAATAMGARYFHACGYNVPEETIVNWRPELLRLEPGIKFVDASGNRREMQQADLDAILERADKLPDGRIRSLASKMLGGAIIGPFEYEGRRADDPNDWCQHENRRELRALYVIASFINHYDTKDQNTLDTYIEENGQSYVKHHLIDFGSTFGSNGDRPKDPTVGYCNTFDLRDVVVSWFTLGLKKWGWEDAKPFQYQSIGYFESEIFQPNKWDPIVPNPAFENMTPRDAYWGAKIVMAWRDEEIRKLVETGQYSDEAAKAYLVKTLIERRDKIGRYWFAKVAPLDGFEFTYGASESSIKFSDLAVKYGLESGGTTKYQLSVRHGGKTVVKPREFAAPEIALAAADQQAMTQDFRSNKAAEDNEHLYEVRISVKRASSGWSNPAVLWLWYHQDDWRFELVGIEHLD